MGEIKVVYEKGIFKPLEDIDLKDGTKAVVVVRPKGIADVRWRNSAEKWTKMF